MIVGTLIGIAGNTNSIQYNGLSLYGASFVLAFAVQWIVFIPSYLKQTEHFYDLTGSLSYLAVTWSAITLSAQVDARATLVAVLVSVWALRLGSFLFLRIRQDGSDSRFDEIKPNFARFLMAWTLQGLWVCLTLAAALVVFTTQTPKPLDAFAYLGLALWLVGFALEAIADRQKRQHRAKQPDTFISSGLWAWSRHPNYFGEILLWTGIAIIALPVLKGWQHAALISPLFVYWLLTKVSGVPMLEAKSDQRYGEDPAYQAYKAATPVLMLRPPRKP